MPEKPYDPIGSRPDLPGSMPRRSPSEAAGSGQTHSDRSTREREQERERTRQELKQGAAEIREKTAEATEQLKRDAQEKARDVRRQAEQAAADAKRQGRAYAEEQKRHAADEIHGTADALHEAADDFRGHEQQRLAGYIDQAASGLDDLASSLRNQDFDQLLHKAERFATRQPAVFLGGAVAVGFVLGRFLKSSARHTAGDYWDEEDRYSEAYAEHMYTAHDPAATSAPTPPAYDAPSHEPRQSATTPGSTPETQRPSQHPDIGKPTYRNKATQPPGE